MTQADPLKPGEILQGKYLIRERLGDGASGTVYLAEHLVLSSEVAIKVLHPRFAENELMRRRFLDEARTLARLKSRYIVRILDADLAASGLAFIAMEYVGASDLERYIGKNSPLAPKEALRIAMEVCRALKEAHSNGIVHRDIKPENILLTEDAAGEVHVKVADFGLAKRVHLKLSRQSTSNDQPIGTPCYMAPEQMLRPAEVDHRADVFSMGVLLYEMLTGFLPFGGESVEQTMQSVLSAEPPRASDLDERISPALSDLIERCLVKDPEARLASVVQLMDEISAIQRVDDETVAQEIPIDLTRSRERRDSSMTASAPAVVTVSSQEPRKSRGLWIPLGLTAAAALVACGAVFIDPSLKDVRDVKDVKEWSSSFQERLRQSVGLELVEDRLPTLPFTMKQTPRSFHTAFAQWEEEPLAAAEPEVASEGAEEIRQNQPKEGGVEVISNSRSQAPYLPVSAQEASVQKEQSALSHPSEPAKSHLETANSTLETNVTEEAESPENGVTEEAESPEIDVPTGEAEGEGVASDESPGESVGARAVDLIE